MGKWRIVAVALAILLTVPLLGIAVQKSHGYTPNGSEYQETLTQVSTIGALLNGVYGGVISYGELKEYGDFGLGTFEGLDGEMVALDGNFYQIRSDGVVYEVQDSMKTPFALVTFFNTDKRVKLSEGMDYADIQEFIDDLIPTENIFYAIKISGTFSYVKTRSVPPQTKPYPLLIEATKEQSTFEFSNVRGTVVGFRSPPYVSGGINLPGYHLHFLTGDGSSGGHLLEMEIKDAELFLDYTSRLFMILPNEGGFYQVDLTQVKQEELERVEK